MLIDYFQPMWRENSDLYNIFGLQQARQNMQSDDETLRIITASRSHRPEMIDSRFGLHRRWPLEGADEIQI